MHLKNIEELSIRLIRSTKDNQKTFHHLNFECKNLKS